ncbi:DNA-3-methyladenine glycosylase I [Zhengella mangrovi]|uniref:DNA-3-methyladenine glycosylase I n=1 Tax=Zhengella mangrovi TaxID=1982044 RepID=A0A2G1QL96_9HYPH|nr:DNA-3-methyladenine glycosylase I [Zhengella mangrovi]PHP66231.1 DNA-3-methyladenine glycosylase I [Zhengella mangrovi]
MDDAGEGLLAGPDGQPRCFWHGGLEDYCRYHDEEWGYPVSDDVRLFEKICLEGFQAGLSWLTILRKRENFRSAFAGFDIDRVARFDDADIARLLADSGIVRHRGKIASTINNAKRAQEMRDEFGSLAAFFWSFEPDRAERPDRVTRQVLVANPVTAASKRLSKDLKKRGWTFVGPTTVYAFMQAMGLVNDHLEGCICRARAEAARQEFERPAATPAAS